jgi:hypothetical protein
MLTKNTDQLHQLVNEHLTADAVIQGDYWNPETKKGCFIGCLTHDSDPAIIADRFGIPIMVSRIAESIFEALSPEEAREFFAGMDTAVGSDGKDLGRVGWQFLAAELRALPEQSAEIQAVIDPVIAGMDLLANGQEWPPAAEAAAAANRAADAAEATAAAAAAKRAAAAAEATAAATAAANRAAAAAEAADAAAAAKRAADAAEAAAAASRAAARAANWAAVVRRQRDTLLRLISEA